MKLYHIYSITVLFMPGIVFGVSVETVKTGSRLYEMSAGRHDGSDSTGNLLKKPHISTHPCSLIIFIISFKRGMSAVCERTRSLILEPSGVSRSYNQEFGEISEIQGCSNIPTWRFISAL
ncbi:hypothetical protein XENOCAPTIV_027943 [Xenoophorus captivus]|uniref:Uncharacterized protein n=1 Tax=Xenoophorus captivus TaxID=1517983 RepID=A0ABV0QNC1_9TELE